MREFGRGHSFPRAWHGLLFFFLAFSMQFLVVLFFSVARQLGLLGDTEEQIISALFSPMSIGLQVLFTTGMLTTIALLVPRLYKLSGGRLLALDMTRGGLLFWAVVGVAGLGFVVDEITYLLCLIWPDLFPSAGLLAFNRVFLEASPLAFALTTVAVSIGPGIGEEFFFRGLLLRIFVRAMPAYGAVLLSSALFGMMHMDRLQGTGAAIIGIYLGFVALRTGSIWPAVLAHTINNLICALFVRYQDPGSAEIWNTGHPPWLVVVAFAVVATAVLAIVRLTPLRDSHG